MRRKPHVTAEHTLNRVRENQRRHRAKRRDHVAFLEQKLAETEQLLEEAKAEIVALKAAQIPGPAQKVILSPEIPAVDAPSVEKPTELIPIHQNDHLSITCPGIQGLCFITTDIPAISPTKLTSPKTSISLQPQLPPLLLPNTATGPPPCCSDESTAPSRDDPFDVQCSTCKMRPPPDPSESTTLCSQAYILISQQNFRNLDLETIREWLANGRRRAQREGEGCRVENGVLLRLLDYISGL